MDNVEALQLPVPLTFRVSSLSAVASRIFAGKERALSSRPSLYGYKFMHTPLPVTIQLIVQSDIPNKELDRLFLVGGPFFVRVDINQPPDLAASCSRFLQTALYLTLHLCPSTSDCSFKAHSLAA